MNSIDTFEQIMHFIQEDFDLSRWEEYAEKICHDLSHLLIKDISGCNFDKEVLPVIRNCCKSGERIQRSHKYFLSTMQKLKSNELLKELDCTVIFLLGLCNGAGWVTKLNRKTVVLIGVEKIIELNWDNETDMKGLIYHELGHVWHRQYRTQTTIMNTASEKSLWRLYSEGFAMFYEQYLCGNFNFYHQDKNGWLKWCRDNKTRIAQDFLNRVDKNQSAQEFFGDWESYQNHSDVGYFLGCEVLKKLSENKCITELANLSLEDVSLGLRLILNS